jgi:hypothetical protein
MQKTKSMASEYELDSCQQASKDVLKAPKYILRIYRLIFALRTPPKRITFN